MLQSGNPRSLRAPDYERMPNGPFGIALSTRADAIAVESAVHRRLRELGHGLQSDVDYDKEFSYKREWYSHIHPDEVWSMVIEEARPFLGLGPNNSFKPTPHRGVGHAYALRLHMSAAPPRVGLTQALGAYCCALL
jgi:hypothetical protein